MANMILGDEVRRLREAKGWSQAELAERVGVSQPTINSIEQGTQRTARALPRIALALGTEISVLDPSFPAGLVPLLSPNDELTTLDNAASAFEAMLEYPRPDIGPDRREGLARLFLDLALEPLDDSSGLTPIETHRERLRLAIRLYLR